MYVPNVTPACPSNISKQRARIDAATRSKAFVLFWEDIDPNARWAIRPLLAKSPIRLEKLWVFKVLFAIIENS